MNRSRVISTGCFLAFLGGAVNAFYLIHLGTSVSHLTGDVSKTAMGMVGSRDLTGGGWVLLAIAAGGFLCGAIAAGFLHHRPDLQPEEPYSPAIMALGLIFLGAYALLDVWAGLSVFVAGAGCGFQNGLANHYRGMVLRTTHITGLMTDLGTHWGMRLRGHRIAAWKLFVPGLLVLAFFTGAFCGSWLVMMEGRRALVELAGVYFSAGLLRACWFRLKGRV